MEDIDLDSFPRPYRHLWRPQLDALTDEHWNSWRSLEHIWVELHFRRRTKQAQRLQVRVASRIIELREQSFKWVSTDAPDGTGRLDTSEWEERSLLSLLGYSVAEGGEAEISRHRRLDGIYLHAVPRVISQVVSARYLAKWGEPQTGARLKQMAENIASSVRSRKHRAHPQHQAIARWEADLAYLKRRHYDGCYDMGYQKFDWPGTDI